MRSRIIEEYKNKLSLTDRQKEILIGTTLGDAHLEKLYTPELSRLKIEHSFKQKEYVNWMYKMLKSNIKEVFDPGWEWFYE